MPEKPRVFKRDGRWVVQRPGFGFVPSQESAYDSWAEAAKSMEPAKVSSHLSGAFDRSYVYSNGIAPVSPWTRIGHYRRFGGDVL